MAAELNAFFAGLVISSFVCPLMGNLGVDISPAFGSLSGGTVLTLSGSADVDGVDSPDLSSVAVDIGGIPCDIDTSRAVSNSSLSCVTRSYPSAQEGLDSPPLTVTVTLNNTHYKLNRTFMYSWDSTPQIYYLDPSSIPVGHMLGFTGMNLPTDPGDIEAVFIGEHPCDLINPTSNAPYPTYTREHTNPFLWMQCLPRQVPPGVYNVSVVVGNGVGRAWRHSNSKYYGPGGQLIMLEVYPDIQSVQPSSSHPLGGELVTITGSGFGLSCGMSVDIDGVPCEVIRSSFNEVKCVTGAAPEGHAAVSEDGTYPTVQEGYRFKGGRGVSSRLFLNIGGSSDIVDLYRASKYPDNPDYYLIYPSYQPEQFRRYDSSGERSQAFFTPQETTTYVLWFEADNEGELFFGTSANVSNVTRIGYVPNFTRYPFGTDLVVNAYLKHDSQRADPMELVAGKSYLIVGAAKEGNGHDYIRAMALLPNSTYTKNESGWVIQDEPGWPSGYFMRPLPGFMLQTVEETPQVHLRVNGLLASCLEGKPLFFENPSPYNGCSFVYRRSRPRVFRTCPSTWELSWNTSILRNSSLVNYTITLEAEGSEKRTLNVSWGADEQGEGLLLTLPIMTMETEHTATITAVLADGTSFSDSVVFYTNSCGVPTSPLSIEFTVSCPYHWLLSWSSPTVTNGDITHFEVEWMDVSSDNSSLLQVPVFGPSAVYEAELKDLSPGTEYYVRVQAHNRNGAGKFSDCLLINSGMCVFVATCTPSCKNGGSCKSDLTCSCSVGWTGKDCSQVVVATCTPSCKNGGSCKSDLTCSCSVGWTGKDCSQDVGGSEVVVPGDDGPPPVVLVGVGIGVLLLLCFLLGLLVFCVLCCFVKNSQRRKKVGPDDKLPLTEAESAEQLVATDNTYMYGDGKLAESGLDSEVEAADPSACSHRIIHVAPFYKYPDGKDGTLVENQGFEQPEELETHLSSDSLTDKISLQVDTSEGGDPQADSHTHDPQADAHTEEVNPSPPSPTSADSPLLPPITRAEEEPSKETDTSRECLLSESNAGEVLQVEGYCGTKEVYSPERDSCLEEMLSSSQGLGINNEALEQASPDVIMGTSHHQVNEEPSECVKRDTTSMAASSTPVLLQSQESLANTTPGQPSSAHPSGRCTPKGSGIVDTATMLPEPDVQPSSKTSLCTSPLPTDTSAPTEHPVTTHEDEVSHELDHEAADSSRLDQDDSTLSCQHPNELRDHCRLSPECPSVTSAPLPPSCTEDTETLTTGQQDLGHVNTGPREDCYNDKDLCH